MINGPDECDGRDERLAEILAAYLEQEVAGGASSPASLATRHPEFADELTEFFAVREQLDAAVRPLRTLIVGADQVTAVPDRGAVDEPGRLGDFRLLREVGRGGMGIVYEAEQISLGRRVALKVLPFAATLDARQLQRFKNEALAAAALDHPNVVDVYGVGTERATHYYAMRFVEGHSLAEVIDQLRRLGSADRGKLPASVSRAFSGDAPGPAAVETAVGMADSTTRRSSFPAAFFRSVAELGLRVAEALDHAHGQGVIHRDIKPSNLLLDGQGKVWVADFGLARFEAAPSLTGTGGMIGTLRYMAPEQALGRPGPADHQCDVYGLGVTLYELLTLRPAFAGGDREELLRQIGSVEPPPPRHLDRSIPRDLETVVLKAMAKELDDRYPTARALADDLRSVLEDRPIRARRPTPAQKLRRWVRRHRSAVMTTAVVIGLLLVVAVAGLAVNNALVTRERDLTRAAEREGRIRLFKSLLAQIRTSRLSGLAGQRLESWATVIQAAELARELGLEQDYLLELRTEAIACLALTDVRHLTERVFPPGLSSPVFDGDLEHYARSDRAGNVTIRRAVDDEEVRALSRPADVHEVASGTSTYFSPDGILLAVCYSDFHVRLWDWRDAREVWQGPYPKAITCTFSPDGRRLALARADGTIAIHDTASGGATMPTVNVGIEPLMLAFSPDGRRLAVGSWIHAQVQILDSETGQLDRRFPLPGGARVAWHPDGVLLAVGCGDRNLYLLNAITGRSQSVLRGHQHGEIGVAFAAGGDILVSSTHDGTTRLWDCWAGRELVRFAGLAHAVSRDGRRLACESGWGRHAFWEIVPGREFRPLRHYRGSGVAGLGGFSPDGRWLAFGSLWDLAAEDGMAHPLVPGATSVLFHPSREELFTTGSGGLYRWPVRKEAGVLRIGPGRKLPVPNELPGQLWQVTLDGEGRRLTALHHGGGFALDLESPSAPAPVLKHADATSAAPVTNVSTSWDGRWAATGTHHGRGVKVWDARTGALQKPLIPDRDHTKAVFGPGGWLVTSTRDEFRLWHAGSWELARTIPRQHSFYNESAAFSPGSRILALTVSLSAVRLLDPASDTVWAELQAPHVGPVDLIGFSRDGGQLAVAAVAGEVRVWDLRRVREQLAEIGLDWDLPAYDPPAFRGAKPMRVEVDFGDDASAWHARSVTFRRRGRWEQALADLSQAVEVAPNDTRFLNNLAWHLATCPDPALRDPERALRLAQQAVQRAGANAIYWNTLGTAQYRNRQWRAAIQSLEQSRSLQGGNSHDDFFLAMAHWQLGDPNEARRCYAEAVDRMVASGPDDEGELDRFRREAARLLGVAARKD